MTSNLKLRILSALVMAAIALAATWLGGVPFRILTALAGLAIFLEWSQLSAATAGRSYWTACFALILVPLILIVFGADPLVSLTAIAAGFFLALIAALFTGQRAWGAYGLLYAALPPLAMSASRGDTLPGLVAIVFLFAVVWATDIFAYFIGRAIGGPKLAPAISPGKTWSGAIGGAACGIAAGVAVALAFRLESIAALALVSLLLSIVSQIGDLFESWIKRRFGAKDSSSFIPGHGGIMDRVDGLVAAALALYVIGWLVSGAANPAAGLFVL